MNLAGENSTTFLIIAVILAFAVSSCDKQSSTSRGYSSQDCYLRADNICFSVDPGINVSRVEVAKLHNPHESTYIFSEKDDGGNSSFYAVTRSLGRPQDPPSTICGDFLDICSGERRYIKSSFLGDNGQVVEIYYSVPAKLSESKRIAICYIGDDSYEFCSADSIQCQWRSGSGACYPP